MPSKRGVHGRNKVIECGLIGLCLLLKGSGRFYPLNDWRREIEKRSRVAMIERADDIENPLDHLLAWHRAEVPVVSGADVVCDFVTHYTQVREVFRNRGAFISTRADMMDHEERVLKRRGLLKSAYFASSAGEFDDLGLNVFAWRFYLGWVSLSMVAEAV